MISLDRWLTLLLLVLFASMLAIGLQYPAEARLVPVTVSLLGLALCLVQLAFDIGSARQAHFAERFHAAPKLGRPDLPTDDPEEPAAEIAQRELLMWGYFLAFVAALLSFGFYVAAPAMIFSYLWRRAQVKWPHALVVSVAAIAVMYCIFSGIFRFVLFQGFVVTAAMNLLSH
jgi:hypothetical protein